MLVRFAALPAIAIIVAIAAMQFGGLEFLRSLLARHMPEHAAQLRDLDQAPLADRLTGLGFRLGQPVVLRLYKEEHELEVWMERDGRFDKAVTFPICTWSGNLGPKLREGDGQSPEGFYLATARQLKPDSSYYRAINIGFPNAFDRQQGRTGSFLMIHGNCVSIGCYAMTDAGIDDIYRAVENAIAKGQQAIPVHIFPFRMTQENLGRHAGNRWHGFWENLSEGDKVFSATGQPPVAGVCGGRYVFAAQGKSLPAGAGCNPVTGW